MEKFKFIEIKPKNILMIKKRFTKNKVIKKQKAIYETFNTLDDLNEEIIAEMIEKTISEVKPYISPFEKEIIIKVDNILKTLPQ